MFYKKAIEMNLSTQFKSRRQILDFIMLFVVCVLLCGCRGKKQKVYRVGIISGLEVFSSTTDGYIAGLAELGYKEGENIVYDAHEVYTGEASIQKVLDKFVADKVDLIFTFPTEPAMLAKAVTRGTNIPVVFAMGTIEGNDLVESVRQPGGNITGIRYSGPDLFVKYLEFLLELSPNAKRVWLTYDPDYPAIPSTLGALRPAASSVGVTLVELPVKSPAEIAADLKMRDQLSDVGIDGILMVPGISHAPDSWAAISAFSAKHKLPIAGGLPIAVEKGETVFTYMPDNIEVGKLAATQTNKILKGTSAGTIPVVTPEPRLRLNYKLAQELGLNISKGLLNRADEIIR
jgi:putative ABC transport system substrate-binding protein